MARILIVDDDVHIGDMVEEVLRREGYLVSRAYSGTEAILALEDARPDLILLDLMLPGLAGEDVLPRLHGIPVIVLSAKADPDSKAELLLGGAADYMTKPFSIRELLARITLRLREAPGDGALVFGPLSLDPVAHTVTVEGQFVHLTRTEYAILKRLMMNPDQLVTKSLLLERIGVDTPDCTESSLKTHMSNLRKKLRQAGGEDWVESVWGIGFKLSRRS